jgi:RNA methyltransferase, TrmH family
MQKYKAYKKDASYSYTLGIFPTIELVTARPELVEAIFVASGSEHSSGIQKLRQLCADHGIKVDTSDKLIARLAPNNNSHAIGIFKKFEAQLSATAPHVVLVNPDDAGNLGTIIRTMMGFDHHSLAIIRPAVDIFDPRVVRASMGSLFKQSTQYFESIEAYRTAFPKHTLYPFMLGGARSLEGAVLAKPYSLVFGNEGAGLPPAYRHIGTPITIEQSDEIDSLNLAVACSVALYHAYINNKTESA